MLKRFSVTNFKNFQNKLSFVLDDPANYGFNTEVVRDGVKTKGLVYGINGSGKTNLGFALFDIIIHLTDKERIQSRYYPYMNLDSKKPVAEFEYVFEFDGTTRFCRMTRQIAPSQASCPSWTACSCSSLLTRPAIKD
jgi:AAA15 family ATPase/GTPase